MPADRLQKSRSPKDVPGLGDPDRKRVLNVLAQRRYRKCLVEPCWIPKVTIRLGQRRREKIAALEAQAKSLEGLVDQRSTSSDDTSPQASSTSATSKSLASPQELPENLDYVEELINVPCEDDLAGFATHGDPFNMTLVQDFSGTYSPPVLSCLH